MNDRGEHPAERTVLYALAGAATLGVLGWLWIGVTAGVFGAGWPQLSSVRWLAALGRLPGHLGDPRRAFAPGALRAGMPSAAAFYVVAVVLVAAAAGTVLAGFRLRDRWLTGGLGARGRRGARWARGGELHTLRGRPRTGSVGVRLGLGYRSRRLLHAEERHALVVFGPPQSGKSAAVAVPNLLEWDGPAIASSIKTDLLDATIAQRRRLGEVMVFDPHQLLGRPGSTWSPLACSDSWTGALSSAMRIAAAGEVDGKNVKGGDFWSAAAEQRLAPLLFAAACTGRDIRSVVRWAYGQGDAELPAILEQLVAHADPGELADCEAAYDAHLGFASLAGETRGSVESMVQMLLRAYRAPIVQQSASSSEISAQRLLSGSATLYLVGDPHRSRLLRPLFLALLQELVDGAYEQANQSEHKRLKRPLLMCLDELGNTAPLPSLGEIASSAPSHNIQLISIFHDIAQARTRYGDQAQTVINSHRARMLLPGVADLETLKYFGGLIGEEEIRDRPAAKQPRQPPRRRPLAAPELLRQIPADQAILVYGRLAPTRLRLRLYFKDRRLCRLAAPAG